MSMTNSEVKFTRNSSGVKKKAAPLPEQVAKKMHFLPP